MYNNINNNNNNNIYLCWAHSPSFQSLHLRHSSFGFSKLSVTSPTSQLIFQPFPRFTYVTTHSPTLPLLHLRHSLFSNPSFASPMSQDFYLRHLASRPCVVVTSETTRTLKTIHTMHSYIHSNKVDMIRVIMMAKWYSGHHGGPKASWHLSYRWGKTPKKPHPGNLSRPVIEPGPAAWQTRMLPPAP